MESFSGRTLSAYYKSGVHERLVIARNLIRASLDMTTGYSNFRLYVTDATRDNIAVEDGTLAVTFIDLDDVIIQHYQGSSIVRDTNAHRHQRATSCENCFSFSTDFICAAEVSDINVFTICQVRLVSLESSTILEFPPFQLLLEDLAGNSKEGFLHFSMDELQGLSPSWLTKWDRVMGDLKDCVYCSSPMACSSRFDLAGSLLKQLDFLLGSN